MTIKWKQIDVPQGSTATSAADGQTLTGTEAAELVAGKDGTGKAQFLATEASGALQVSDAGGSLTVDSAQLPAALVSGRLAVDASGVTQPISMATPIPDLTQTGTLAAFGDALTVGPLDGRATLVLSLAGVFSGTVTTEVSTDNVQWTAITGRLPNVTTVSSITAGVPSNLEFAVAGYRYFRARFSAYTSGSTFATINASAATGAVTLSGALPGGTASLGYVGIGNSVTSATVKAASTAAAATDPALVVAVSPNNTVAVSAAALPLPSGASTSALQGTGNTSLGSIDTKTPALVSGRVPVDGSGVTQDVNVINSTLSAIYPDVETTGTIVAANGAVTTPDLNGHGTGAFDISGTFTATLQFEGSVNGTTWQPVPCKTPNGTSIITSIGSGGFWRFATAGLRKFRIRASAYTSGTVNVTIRTSAGTSAITFADALPPGSNIIGAVTASGTWTVSQGSAAAIGNSWFAKISDGTNGPVAVKGASTSAVAADPALVVAVSPNNTIAVSAASLPLPSGAASETTLAAMNAKIPAVGQAVMASSQPVVIASNQSAVPVSGTVVATVSGVAQDATLTNGNQKAVIRGGAKGTTVAADVTSRAAGANSQPLEVAIVDAAGTQITTFNGGAVTVSNFPATQPVSAASLPLPSGAASETTLASMNAKMPALGQAAMAASQPVVIASNQSAIPVVATRTGATASTAFPAVVTTTSSQVLAANANRVGCCVSNGGTTVVYLYLDSVAATLGRFTIQLNPNDYYEFPQYEGVGCYRGAVQAISASGSPGLMIQEFVA